MQEFFDNNIDETEESESWQLQLSDADISKFDTFVENATDWLPWSE
jgi:hypothetical protein